MGNKLYKEQALIQLANNNTDRNLEPTSFLARSTNTFKFKNDAIIAIKITNHLKRVK